MASLQQTNMPYKFVECTKQNLDTFPITDGCVYFTDTGEIYIDEGGKRKSYTRITQNLGKSEYEYTSQALIDKLFDFYKSQSFNDNIFEFKPVPFAEKESYVLKNGVEKPMNSHSPAYKISDFIDVTNFKMNLVINNEYGNDCVAFYDELKNHIGSIKAKGGGEKTTVKITSFDFPYNCEFIRIGYNSKEEFECSYINVVPRDNTVLYENFENKLKMSFEPVYEAVQLEYKKPNNMLNADGTFTTYDGSDCTDFIPISDNIGKVLLTGKKYYNSVVMCAYDANKKIIKSYSEEVYNDTLVSFPNNAKYYILCNNRYAKVETVFKTITKYSPNVDSKKWQGKKWTCVGDSLTEVNIRTTKHYHDYISEKTGITVINMGVSGSGYKNRENDNNAFYQRVPKIPTDSDVVTIFGSGNDLSLTLGTPTDSGTETICGCINTTIDNIYKIMPTVQLGIITPTPWAGNAPSKHGSMEKYANAVVEICKNRSIPCLDLYHCSNLRPDDANFRQMAYSKDEGNGVHPDETGHKIIAPRFEAFLDSLIL